MLDQVGYNTSGLSQHTVSRLNEIANFIERDKKYGFFMDSVLETQIHEKSDLMNRVDFDPDHFCGTAGCIAGYIGLYLNPNVYMSMKEAGDWLGLSSDKANGLFGGTDDNNTQHTFSSITRAVAVKTIRNLSETGKIDFAKAGARADRA